MLYPRMRKHSFLFTAPVDILEKERKKRYRMEQPRPRETPVPAPAGQQPKLDNVAKGGKSPVFRKRRKIQNDSVSCRNCKHYQKGVCIVLSKIFKVENHYVKSTANAKKCKYYMNRYEKGK